MCGIFYAVMVPLAFCPPLVAFNLPNILRLGYGCQRRAWNILVKYIKSIDILDNIYGYFLTCPDKTGIVNKMCLLDSVEHNNSRAHFALCFRLSKQI